MISPELLYNLNLEDVLKLLPKRIKYISIWHYLMIKRGENTKKRWIVIYGEHQYCATRLKDCVIQMLLFIDGHGYCDVAYRYKMAIKRGYIKLEEDI